MKVEMKTRLVPALVRPLEVEMGHDKATVPNLC